MPSVHGSRKSAIHGSPVARFRRSPGHLARSWAASSCRRATRPRGGRAAAPSPDAPGTQAICGSGTSSSASPRRTPCWRRGAGEAAAPPGGRAGRPSPAGRRAAPARRPAAPASRGARTRTCSVRCTAHARRHVARAASRRAAASAGCDTVCTTGSQPCWGRYFTNFSVRCTPPPPCGGKAIGDDQHLAQGPGAARRHAGAGARRGVPAVVSAHVRQGRPLRSSGARRCPWPWEEQTPYRRSCRPTAWEC